MTGGKVVARLAPSEYSFNEADYELYAHRFWRMPVRLAPEGVLRRVWDDGSSRGNPTASSLLAVLALHVWLQNDGDEWTRPQYLSHRRLAVLAGISRASVVSGLAHLASCGLLLLEKEERHARDGGPERKRYRLHGSLYPRDKSDKFVQVSGSLIYGGVFAMLPRPSARQLLLVILCSDPVHDEAALRDDMAAEGNRDESQIDARIARLREESPLSLRDLASASGMSGSVVQQAIDILTRPVFGGGAQPLVLRDEGQYGRYFRLNGAALGYIWNTQFLNDPAARASEVARHWGDLLRRAA